MHFNNVKEGIDWLENQPRFRPKTSLDYIKIAYNMLNINFNNIKKIHVAGTNGKGSTSAFLTNVLVNNNLNVGTFTSPYLVTFNERIRLNNININDEDLLKYINLFYELNDNIFQTHDFKLSFFEIVTLISFKYFFDSNVDIMIIEVGIGGRLDATNILDYDVSLITSIGLDHMKQLGNTIEEITSEKLGILKPNGYLISSVEGSIKELMINKCQSLNAKSTFIDPKKIESLTNNRFIYLDNEFKLNLLGDYQRTNALIAFYAIKYLYNFEDNKIIKYLETTKWDGRLDEVFKNVYLDGAHNIPAIEALMRNFNNLFIDKEVTILFSALKDKEILEMLKIIKKYDVRIILTSFPDFRFESLDSFTDENTKYIEDGISAFNDLVKNKKDNEVIVATGSLHFIGYLKQYIEK